MMCAVETRVLETAAETAALQQRLSNRCVLAEYSDRVRTGGGRIETPAGDRPRFGGTR